MAEHKINCPNCAQHLAVPEELAGQQIDCPSCNKPMTLPSDTFYEKEDERIEEPRQSPALIVGIVAGVCSRAVIGVATGVMKSCAVGGIVLYASQYSGFFKLDTAKIKRSARALVGKVDLLGALEKLGFPDDPAGIKAHAFDLAEDQWEANEHRALGGVVGFGASFMV